MFRANRPPVSLQQLWTWSCALTEGRPVSSMAWNSANNNLLAAGYRSRTAVTADPAAAATASEFFLVSSLRHTRLTIALWSAWRH